MLKRTVPTVAYYVIGFIAFWLLEDASPSGPCTPGLGIMAFILFIPVSFAMLFRNVYVSSKVGKANWLSTGIHLVCCLFMISPFIFH